MTVAFVSRFSPFSPVAYTAPTICSAHQPSTCAASTSTIHSSLMRYNSCRRYASTQPTTNNTNSSGLSCYVWGTSSTIKYPHIAKTQLRPTEMEPPDTSGFKQVTFGQQHTALLSGDGKCYTFGSFFAEPKSAITSWFGSKTKAEESDSSTTGQLQPVTNINEPIKQIGLGVAHTIILTEAGKVYTYGYGGSFMSSGALGHGNTETLQQPKLVEGLQDVKVVRIASGSWHNLALTDDGKVYAWGRGEHGRLGTGSSNDVAVPVLLEALKHVKVSQIRAGTSFNAAITDDGKIFTFGRNNAGQLGLGAGLTLDTYSMESVPSEVEFDLSSDASITDDTIDDFRLQDIDCGYRHAVCVDNHHHVWYWGQNKNFTPLLIKGDDSKFLKNDIVRVAAGKNFSAAIDKHGHLFTWGDGGSCCLGHGDKTTVKWPRLVEGFGPTNNKNNTFGRVVSIFAGDTHIAVLTKKD